jgi:flagellar biosynthesis regulator FlaF
MYQSAYNDIMEAGAASTRSREKEALERPATLAFVRIVALRPSTPPTVSGRF